ncbi:MAG: hypothetical protein AAFN79_12390 [Pseudomonadota bacterium]
MGDRTHCTLMIGGEITEDAFADLVEALSIEDPDDFDGPTLEEALLTANHVEFREVNGGALSDDLDKALIAAGAAFRWSWGDGGSYGPGVTLYDPKTGERGDYGTLDGEIALRVADTENPDVLRHANRWLNFEREFPALVVGNDVESGEAAQ